MSEVHAQARTTPRTRAEIKNSTASLLELAKRYNISVATARKWKQRDSPEDLSHRPHKLCTTLTPAQEAIAVAVRSLTLLGLDDLVAVVREFINPDVSRSGLDRCLRRHGVANLRQLQAQALADAGQVEPQVKTFKDYEPGFLHMDIKYLPRMPDEKQRRYLFVAIDRATRWVFMHIYADQSEQSSVDFLNRLERAAPMKIVKLLTDNGSQFTDRFTSKKREPTGCHDFDVRCGELGIEHRLCPPRHPQTNGMVERFNGRISEVVKQTRFASAAELETTLERYVKTYNQLIPQRALNHLSPIQALKEWQKKKPKLFKKRVYNQPGLDNITNGLAVFGHRGDVGVHPVKAAILGAVFHDALPGRAGFQGFPQIGKRFGRHVRVTHHIVAVANQLGFGKAAQCNKGRVGVGDNALQIGAGDNRLLGIHPVFGLIDRHVDFHVGTSPVVSACHVSQEKQQTER